MPTLSCFIANRIMGSRPKQQVVLVTSVNCGKLVCSGSGRGLANPHALKTACGDVLIITSYDCACFILPSVLFPAKKDPSSKASRHLNCTRICNSHTTQGIQSSPQLTPPSNGSGNHEMEITTVSPTWTNAHTVNVISKCNMSSQLSL